MIAESLYYPLLDVHEISKQINHRRHMLIRYAVQIADWSQRKTRTFNS